MKSGAQKNRLGGHILYGSLDPSKNGVILLVFHLKLVLCVLGCHGSIIYW